MLKRSAILCHSTVLGKSPRHSASEARGTVDSSVTTSKILREFAQLAEESLVFVFGIVPRIVTSIAIKATRQTSRDDSL